MFHQSVLFNTKPLRMPGNPRGLPPPNRYYFGRKFGMRIRLFSWLISVEMCWVLPKSWVNDKRYHGGKGVNLSLLTAPWRVVLAGHAMCHRCSAQFKQGGANIRVNKVNRSRANQLLMTEWPGPGMSHDPQMVRPFPWPSRTHHADKRHSKDKHRSRHPSSAGQKTLFNYSLLRCLICFSFRSQNSSVSFPCWMLFVRAIVSAAAVNARHLGQPDKRRATHKSIEPLGMTSSPDRFHREEQSQVSNVRMFKKIHSQAFVSK